MSKKLAVLVSGTGSLLQAMIEQGLEISLVVADRECPGVAIAQNAGICTELLFRRKFGKGETFDRVTYTHDMVRLLKGKSIDLVAMAGFMTLFAQRMFDSDAYQNRLLNTHPALLPSFKGNHAVRDALERGVKVTGCTVHFAVLERDEGVIVAQEAVYVRPGDTESVLHERIKQAERVLYPKVIKRWRNGEDIITMDFSPPLTHVGSTMCHP